ncbi:MAG: GAF domain-containing protein, partial [Verrucomicrobiae bacterium]|nr:GAF domain-containing protein [Verrucomicrobiae bacterium]
MEGELSAEQRRLDKLRNLEILDTPQDPRFDRVVDLAQELFPGFQCAIVFVDERRVWAKANDKKVQCEYSKDQSFCGYAVQSGEQLQLEDTLNDGRFLHLDAVRKAGIRFYANRLLRALDGTVVGSICLRHTKAHQLSEEDVLNLDLLGAMANEALNEIEEAPEAATTVDTLSMLARVLADSPLATVWLTFPELEYVDANRAAIKLLGQSRDALLGNGLDAYASGDHSILVRHLRLQLELRRKTAPFEFTFKTAIGDEKIVALTGQMIVREGVPSALMYLQDVTRARVRERKTRWLFEGTSAYTGADFFRYCCESVARMTGGNVVTISRLISGNRVLQLCLWHNGRFLRTSEIDISGAPCERVLYGETVYIGDNLSTAFDFEGYRNMGLRSFIGVPIRGTSQDILGHLAVMGESPMAPDPDRELMMSTISSRIASEILRADAEAFRRDDLRRAKLLQRISREIRKSLKPGTILKTAAEEIGVAFRVSRCQIFVIEDFWTGEPLPAVAEYRGPAIGATKESTLDIGADTVFGKVLTSDDALVINDYRRIDVISQEAVSMFEDNDIDSLLAVRISNRTVATGLIVLQQCGGAREWQRQDIVLLESIADQLGIGLAHAKALVTETQRASELLDAQEKAEAASRAKGDFLARMSHELRTPLNSILGFSRLLATDPDATESHLETLRIINRSGEHLLSLISDVLEMSKIEAGQTEVESAPMSLRELIESIGDMFQLRAETNELDFVIECAPDLPTWIRSDQKKLRQILTNLLGNAFKFTRQ